jgi:hypothetical protein
MNPPSCSLAHITATGVANSNLATPPGSWQSDATVDSSPGGTCNILTEVDTFVFDVGTFVVHARHEDCATHGLRVDGTFDVTGGTGAFQGATGGGRLYASAAAPSPIIFNGTITF